MCASMGATDCHNKLNVQTTVKTCFLCNDLDGCGEEDRQTQREREEPDTKKEAQICGEYSRRPKVTPHRCS